MKAARFTMAVLASLALVACSLSLFAQAPDSGANNPFSGKVLQVHVKSPASASEQMKDMSIRKLGGKDFLVGTNIEEGYYREGLQIWIAVDDIAQISVFDSIEDLKQRMKPNRAKAPSSDNPGPASRRP